MKIYEIYIDDTLKGSYRNELVFASNLESFRNFYGKYRVTWKIKSSSKKE